MKEFLIFFIQKNQYKLNRKKKYNSKKFTNQIKIKIKNEYDELQSKDLNDSAN